MFVFFSPCTISCWHEQLNIAICKNMLNCWPSTPISRLPASQAAQTAHFPGASTGLDSEVGLNGPRNCPFGEPSSNIGQLPPGKMGRLSSDHSFCSKCCHMASKRGLKGPSNKTAWWLGASLSMCLVTLKKEPPVRSLQLISTMSRICAQHWVFALKGHVEINLTLSKESYVSKTSLDFLPKIPKSRPVRG